MAKGSLRVEKKVEPLPEVIPLSERIARYREYAQNALAQALLTEDPMRRTNLLATASAWHTLALRAQKIADRPESITPGSEAAPPDAPEASPKN